MSPLLKSASTRPSAELVGGAAVAEIGRSSFALLCLAFAALVLRAGMHG